MRITGGWLKGRTLPDKKLNLRPTTNRAKQGLLNMLNHRIDWVSCKALDLFGGTGNLTFEMASRGCLRVTAVEISKKNSNFIRQNLMRLGLNNVQVIRGNALSFLQNTHESWTLIFCDPPYDFKNYDTIIKLIFDNRLLIKDGLLVIEHSRRTSFSSSNYYIEQRKYGEVNFSFFGYNGML